MQNLSPLKSAIPTTCSLCNIKIGRSQVFLDEKIFCCHGCRSVYQILSIRGELENFGQHPIFHQALEGGLISNPNLLEEIQKKQKSSQGERKKIYFEIEEMWCPACAEVIKWILLQEKGVRNCVVDYATDLASVEYSPQQISKESVLNKIRQIGYLPRSIEDMESRKSHFKLNLRLFIALFCMLNIMMLSYPIYAGWIYEEESEWNYFFALTSFIFSLPILFYSALPIFRRFATSLLVGIWGMEALVAIGTSAAFLLSCYALSIGSDHVYFDSMAAIIVFVLLGKSIESRAKFSAKETLFRLTCSLPKKGRKQQADGSYCIVLLKEIKIDDLLMAVTGEKIVLDGEIIEGEGAIDESSMTGESIPILRKKTDLISAGTLVKSGKIYYRVTSTLEQSTLKKVIEMIERDILGKSKEQRVTDTIIKWFVPTIVCLSFMTFCVQGVMNNSWTEGVWIAVSVLLISCPCAIGIAAPLAESLLMRHLAKLGVLVRNRNALKKIGKETIYFFDKTGTVTEGKFKVLSGLPHLDVNQKKSLKAMTQVSNHPISVAIKEAIQELPREKGELEEHTGLGIRAIWDHQEYFLGSKKFMEIQGINCHVPKNEKLSPLTYCYFAFQKELCAIIELGDQVRQEVPRLLDELLPTQSILISGDLQVTVEKVAKSCGFKTFFSEKTPLEKREIIDQMQQSGQCVAVVGDGINDAPSLTCADVGISVMSAADISIQVSDLLLTSESLEQLPLMRKLACKGRRIIHQNLFWAFFYNCIGLLFAASGHLSPFFAAIAMIASSLIVLFNSLRLRF